MTNPSYEHFVTQCITGTKRANGLAPAFLVNMTSDHLINDDSHEYEYEQDSDLDEEDDDPDDTASAPQRNPLLGKFQMTRSASKPQTPSEPHSLLTILV